MPLSQVQLPILQPAYRKDILCNTHLPAWIMYLFRRILLATVLYAVLYSNAASVPIGKLEPPGNDGNFVKQTSDRFGPETKVRHSFQYILAVYSFLRQHSHNFKRVDRHYPSKPPQYWEVNI